MRSFSQTSLLRLFAAVVLGAVSSIPSAAQSLGTNELGRSVQLLNFPPPPTFPGSSLHPGTTPPISLTSSTSSTSPTLPLPSLIFTNFVNAERKFRETLIQFSFKRDVVLQTIGRRGQVTGEYLRNSIFVLDDSGRRVEQVVYHPRSTIDEMNITKEDIQDLAGSQLFGLETERLQFADFAYDLSFVREEILNGRPAYVLAVRPKQEPNPHQMRARFFVGQIWIDAVSFQTLKLRGITEPHGKQRFPVFETERGIRIEDQVFPSKTTADDVLHFAHRDVHYRIQVRYYDFKRFASRLKVVEVEE